WSRPIPRGGAGSWTSCCSRSRPASPRSRRITTGCSSSAGTCSSRCVRCVVAAADAAWGASIRRSPPPRRSRSGTSSWPASAPSWLHLVHRLSRHRGCSYLRVSTDEGADPGLELPPDQRGEVDSPASIRYRSTVLDALEAPAGSLPGIREIQDAMQQLLAAGHDEEIDRGATLTGPHRDDME